MKICIECWEEIVTDDDLTKHCLLHQCGTDGLVMTPGRAQELLDEINADIDKGRPMGISLRKRMNIYYVATGTTPETYEGD